MHPLRRELKRITAIALPVALTQASLYSLSVVDTWMLFAVGVEEADAAALGRTFLMGTWMVAFGVLFGLDPIMSQAWGARDRRKLGTALQQGLLLCGLLSIPTGLAAFWCEEFLVLLKQNPELAPAAEAYVLVQVPALPCMLLFVLGRQYLNCRGIVYPPLVIGVAANLVNVGVNWIFIYGNWGAPRLGATGAGIATAIVELFMAGGLFLWIKGFRLQRAAWAGWDREAWRLAGLAPVFAIGLPIALQLGLEIWAFLITTLWAGQLGDQVVPLAAHNLVLQLASLSFMLPLGISIGVAARVGNLIGSGDTDAAQRSAWLALALGAAVMLANAIALVLLREKLPAWFTDDAAVVALCAGLLPIAAAFQIFDGVQVVGGGILRGMGRTRPAALINLIAFYVLALPLGYWWCFELGHGLAGLWWGLGTALAIVAVLFVAYIHVRGPRTVERAVRRRARPVG